MKRENGLRLASKSKTESHNKKSALQKTFC